MFYEKPHTSPESINVADTVNTVLPEAIEINNISNNLINNSEFIQSNEIKEIPIDFIF